MTGRISTAALEGLGVDCNAIVLQVQAQESTLQYTLFQQTVTRQLSDGGRPPGYGPTGESILSINGAWLLCEELIHLHDEGLRKVSTAQDADIDHLRLHRLRTTVDDDIKRMGTTLARTLIPESTRHLLRGLSDAQVLTIVSDINWIPWEALYVEELDSFLGDAFVVARQIPGVPGALNQANGAPSVGVLPFVSQECFEASRERISEKGFMGFALGELHISAETSRAELASLIAQHRGMGLLCRVDQSQVHLVSRDVSARKLDGESYTAGVQFFRDASCGDAVFLLFGCGGLAPSYESLDSPTLGQEFTRQPWRCFLGNIGITNLQDCIRVADQIALGLADGKSVGRSLWEAKRVLREATPEARYFGLCGEWDMTTQPSQENATTQ